MQVNLTISPALGLRPTDPPPAARPPARPRDEAAFSQAEALQRDLAATPDARPEEVSRARDLFTSVPYPPVEIIQRLSRLLAREWTDSVA